MRTIFRYLVMLLIVAGCDDFPEEPPRPTLESIKREWGFSWFNIGSVGETKGDLSKQDGGVVEDEHDHGPIFFPPWEGPYAKGEVSSNASGYTFWASTQAPHATDALRAVGSGTFLRQRQRFRKTVEDAKLRFVVTKVFLEAIDGNPGLPTQKECPWLTEGASLFVCRRVMWAFATFAVSARSFDVVEGPFCDSSSGFRCFFRTGGSAHLSGWNEVWDYEIKTDHDAMVSLWDYPDFDFDNDVDGDGLGAGPGGMRSQLRLRAPITIEVPVSRLELGAEFEVVVVVSAKTLNYRQRESYLSAYLRDPLSSEGLGFSYEGLEPIETPPEIPTEFAPEPAPQCESNTAGASGTMQFARADHSEPELPTGFAPIVVTRKGGSDGAVSVRFTTSDGTAVAGPDYTPVTTHVLFADGEEGSRVVEVPIVSDSIAEPDKTVTLTLSDPRGCATLGAQSTATLTIFDDDRPIPVDPTYTVGGTVTGLVGTGLVLNLSRTDITPNNGSFVFPDELLSGSSYEVTVTTQPTNPIQACTVINGSGTIGDVDVTDVEVECVTPPSGDGPLDPTFGGDGRVTDGTIAGATDMALQSDDKLVIVEGNIVARYLADGGGLDANFGSGGVVDVGFPGTSDVANAVAVQPDGKIVVAGHTQTGSFGVGLDMAVARFNSDGSPDTDFGDSSQVTIDFDERADRAWDVAIQPDGAIVIVGQAGFMTGGDVAAVRYTGDGELDPSFGTDGVVITDIAGAGDFAYGVALHPDGGIVVAGRVARDTGSDPDVGLVRYDAQGVPDPAFGINGVVRLETDRVWDQAEDVAVQPDGKIVVGGYAKVRSQSLPYRFMVGRFNTDGTLDSAFGGGGQVIGPEFSNADDFGRAMILQPDGKIVVVGEMSNAAGPDFGVARYNSDGSFDADFGNDGRVGVDFFGASDVAYTVVVQADGKLLVGGAAVNGSDRGLGLVRLIP